MNRVPDKALEAMLQGNDDWLTLLDYVNGDDTSMVPSDGACASLRLFDLPTPVLECVSESVKELLDLSREMWRLV